MDWVVVGKGMPSAVQCTILLCEVDCQADLVKLTAKQSKAG